MANEEAHQGLHSCTYQEGNSFTIVEVMKLFIIIGVLSYLSILFKLMFVWYFWILLQDTENVYTITSQTFKVHFTASSLL